MEKVTTHIVKRSECNAYGTLFGGIMMAWVDEAGGIFARRYTGEERMVTLLFEKFEFHQPVYENSIIDIYADNPKIGTTSLAFDLVVTISDGTHVVSTSCVFVCVDDNLRRKKITRINSSNKESK